MSSKQGSDGSKTVVKNAKDEDKSTAPDFIYGGPFIKHEKISPILDLATPINLPLQGTFKQSFAYYTLKERVPVILTKVIDYLSREGSKIKSTHQASDADITGLIQHITKLKSDLITNKQYDLLTVETPEAKRWNSWILACEHQYYFTNTWLFSECYVYRKLREGCELSKGLKNFDPFDEQKDKAFAVSTEIMCIVAEKLLPMLAPTEKDKRKADLMTLLKLCLWANKCDLSLSNGEQLCVDNAVGPFDMVQQLKDMVLVDDSGKFCDQLIAKAEALAKTIEGTTVKAKCSCNRLATLKGIPLCEPPPEAGNPLADKQDSSEAEAPPEIPCPAKMTAPSSVTFDIICDNAGYELFTDLCVAHYLIAQEIVKKVRFHVKSFGWFVSDVTPRDFEYVISSCANARYNREFVVPAETKPDTAEGEESKLEKVVISSEALRTLGQQWGKFVEDGIFAVSNDDFYTSPHPYKDMKKYSPGLYRQLQTGVGLLVKGDLNYRKLLADKNWNPTTPFEKALQGFMPSPLLALRTVKADIICGLPAGKAEALTKTDPDWMRKGDYGVIQYCGKSEALKVSEFPCEFYGDACRGVTCPKT